jgi:phage/plasmid-associated DNA primase
VLEWFISWIGKKGANSKGTTTSLCNGTFGEYMINSDPSLYTSKNTDSGKARPEWLRLKGVRLDILQEPDEDQKLQPASIKPITGRDKLAVRGLYSSTIEFKPQVQPMMCSNNQPEIAGGKVDGGMERRLMNIPFDFVFCNNPDPAKNQKQANSDLKTKFETNEEYHQQFFLLLADYYKLFKDNGKKIEIPVQVMKLTKEYILRNNCIMKFLEGECEITNDDDDMVSSFELYTLFKASDFYNMSSKVVFKEEMVSKNGFKYIKCKKSGEFRNVWVYTGLKLIKPDYEIIDEFDEYN